MKKENRKTVKVSLWAVYFAKISDEVNGYHLKLFVVIFLKNLVT